MAAAADGGYHLPDAVFQRLLGNASLVNRQLLLDHFGTEFPVDEFRAEWRRHFRLRAADRLSPKPGATELLDMLDAVGLKRAIATSSDHATANHHLQYVGWSGRFHAVVAHGDYQAGKPAPDPFLVAAARLGVAPGQCLALEDSHNGVRSAAAAGMMTVMVPDMLPATEEMRTLCVAIASDLFGVQRLLEAALAA